MCVVRGCNRECAHAAPPAPLYRLGKAKTSARRASCDVPTMLCDMSSCVCEHVSEAALRAAADARVPVPPLCRSRPGFPFPLAVAAAAVPPQNKKKKRQEGHLHAA